MNARQSIEANPLAGPLNRASELILKIELNVLFFADLTWFDSDNGDEKLPNLQSHLSGRYSGVLPDGRRSALGSV